MTVPVTQPPEPSPPSRSRGDGGAELTARTRSGDEDAFEQLFLGHYASLCQFVDSYVHAPDIAEEIVQGVFLRVWEHHRAWDPRGNPRAYLFASCRNQALDWIRHERIVAQSIGQSDDLLGVGHWSKPVLADAELEAAELAEQLRVVVAELPERRRLVVILRWQHQLSNPEIAQILGISVKGVEMQFSRALADLRRRLGRTTLDLV